MKADNRNIFAIKAFLREYLDLRKDKDNELATVDSIRKGVEFKGANLWILIFAIFMAVTCRGFCRKWTIYRIWVWKYCI